VSGARSGGAFSFRLNSDAQKAIADLRELAGSSDQVNAAFQRLIQASPQLASVNDNVQRKMRETAGALKETKTAAQETGSAFAGLGASFTKAGLIGAGIGFGIEAFQGLASAIKEAYEAIPKAGEEFKAFHGQLTSATGSATQATAVLTQLVAVSRATGTSLADTVGAFGRYNIAARDLGATSDQVVKLIEGIQRLGLISGTSGQALASATTQLGQALASGNLGGDELKSILENMPQLAVALARELGVPMGQLRQMGTDGKLLSVDIFPALERVASRVGSEFAGMPVSMTRSMAAAQTATTQLLAHFDTLLDKSGSIARMWDRIASVMDRARVGLGGATYAEADASRVAEIADIKAKLQRLGNGTDDERKLLELYRGQGLSERQARDLAMPLMPGETGQGRAKQISDLRERQAALELEKFKADADERTRIGIEGERAYLQGVEGLRARSAEKLKEVSEALDPRVKATRELDEARKALEQSLKLGQVDQERYNELWKEADERFAKATKSAETAGAAVGKLNEPISEFLKLRGKIEADAEAVALALDPFAAAWAKSAEQVEKLTAAMALFEESGGARGMSPDRAMPLIQKAQQDLIDGQYKLVQGAGRVDSAFSQFFSNATSKAEDAIINFRSLGDVINGIGQDIARLLLRIAVTGPIADGLSGLLSGAGGASGLLSGAGNWLSGLFGGGAATVPIMGAASINFADGGVMTNRGPLALRRYASGGIADSPQLAMFGEGRTPEAYVPLPDGRSIPVTMRGGAPASFRGGDVIVHVTNSGASPEQIAAAAQDAANRANRQLIDAINRGGSVAKTVGRRR
jgi:tape measure domain-containing protein